MRFLVFFWVGLQLPLLAGSELSFEAAIEQALASSRQLKITRTSWDLAHLNVLQDITQMTPQLSLGWTGTEYNSAIQIPFNGQNVVIRPQTLSSGFLQAQQPLSPLIGLIQKIRADSKSGDAAKAGYEFSRVEIAFAAAQSYRSVQQLQQLDLIASERVNLALRQETEGKTIFDAGRISKSDLLRIKMRTGEAKTSAAGLHAQYLSTLQTFKNLLGFDLSDDIILSSIPEQSQDKSWSPPIIEQRLDIKASHLQYQANQENSWLNAASFLPNLSVYARFDKNFINAGNFTINDMYSVGLMLNWTFWDGGARLVNLRSASLMTYKSRLEWLETSRKADIDQEQRRLEFDAALTMLDLQKTSFEQAQEAYEASNEKFKLGGITVTDLLQSELDLNAAKVNWAKARTDLDIKYMALQKAYGKRYPETLL